MTPTAEPVHPERAARLSPDVQRQRIANAAAELLADRPFADVTVEMLREELGLSKGGLYHHVGSKNEILLLVCDTAGEALLASLAEAAQLPVGSRARLALLLERHLDLVERYGGALWAFFSERNRLAPDERERVLEWERRYLRGVEQLLEEAREEGVLGDVDIQVAAHTFVGAANWVTRWHRGKPSREAMRETLATILFDGMLRD